MKTIFAAIGSDGTREVVWGLGNTEAEAEADAARWAEGADPEITRTVEIDAATAERVRAGEVGVKDLGIGKGRQ